MILKQINLGGNFRSAVKRRVVYSIASALLGAAAIVFSILYDTHISSFLSGFYAGTGCALAGIGLVNIVKNSILLRNTEKFKKAELAFQDERNRFITSKAGSICSFIMIFLLYSGTIAAGPLNMTVFFTLLVVLAVLCLVLLVCYGIMKMIY